MPSIGRILRMFLALMMPAVFLESCALPPFLPQASPTPEAPIAFTLPPEWTETPSPIPATPTPRATSTPGCELDRTLHDIKSAIPYEEFAVNAQKTAGTFSLTVWYVDPELDPYPSAEELAVQRDQALLRAARVTMLVHGASPCTEILFDVINPIVVDGQYQGWISAQISPGELPQEPECTDEDLQDAAGRFRIGYERTALSHSYVKGSCDWPEARDRLQSHFAPDRENVAFYFVIDDLGSEVWVQWDGSADPLMSTLSLGNIFLALECFSPTANIIYIIVDERGVTQQVGFLPEGDSSRLSIVYP